MMKEQDEGLEMLGQSAERLSKISLGIHEELGHQNKWVYMYMIEVWNIRELWEIVCILLSLLDVENVARSDDCLRVIFMGREYKK